MGRNEMEICRLRNENLVCEMRICSLRNRYFLSRCVYSDIREFKIYDATVAKTSLKIASSSLSIFFVIISVCVTFESLRNYSGTEFRGAVSSLGKKIRICVCVFTFSLKLENGHFTSQICRERERNVQKLKRHVKGVQSFCFASLNMENLRRCRYGHVVYLKLS